MHHFAGLAAPVPSTSSTNCHDIKLSNGQGKGDTHADENPPNRPGVFHGKGSFPLNLTLMLESVESMGLGHIVSWLPSGQSFVIHDPDLFLKDVLPKFFK